MPKAQPDLMDKIISLAKRRGFIFPGSEIYGGLANSWDYGPLGVELKNNIKKLWWKMFVQERGDMVGLDAALLMNKKVWEASGHLTTFSDPLIECKVCHGRSRADQIDGLTIVQAPSSSPLDQSHSFKIRADVKCPICGSPAAQAFLDSDLKNFNLMLKTHLGPVDPVSELDGIIDGFVSVGGHQPTSDKIKQVRLDLESSEVYFRPETAQAIYVDFKQIQETSRMKIPFGVAQIGKAFRNEITPGNFIFRQREFEQMEIEYFIRGEEWEKHFDHWLGEMKRWIKAIGLDESKVHYEEISDEDRAFYSKRTIDVEFEYPFGQKELYGLAYRSDYDLKQHEKFSGKDLAYKDPVTNEKFVPHVIEPSLGVDRTVLAVLLSSYTETEARSGKDDAVHDTEITLRLPKELAPIKIAILPLSKKEELAKPSEEIYQTLRKRWMTQYDETGSIGKRYRRQDEIGTPYCITIDFDTLNDQAVTVRDRDTMQQERVKISELLAYFQEKLQS